MKRSKELTWAQVRVLIEQCKYHADFNHDCDEKCPLFGECLYYYTGDDICLWENESEDNAK